MVQRSVLTVSLLLLLTAALSACGRGLDGSQASGIQQAGLAPAMAPVLPPPSTLRGASYAADKLWSWGKDFPPALPNNRASADGYNAALNSNWSNAVQSIGELAYATYHFDLSSYDLEAKLRVYWESTDNVGSAWVALAEFPKDRWRWYPLPAGGELAFDPASNISATGDFYAVIALSGVSQWKLRLVGAGPAYASVFWPMLGHDPQHTGLSGVNGPATNNVTWSYEAPDAIWSPPVVGFDGTIYFGCCDNNLYAINPNTTLKWTFPTGGYISGSPAVGPDGTVYVVSWDNLLYAVNPDGSKRWQYPAGASSPLVGPDGTIYFGLSGDAPNTRLVALNQDGTEKWTSVEIIGGSYAGPALGPDGTVYTTTLGGAVLAMNPDGTTKWRYETGDKIWSAPTVGADGVVYVSTGNNTDDPNVFVFNPDGSVKWSYVLPRNSRSTPALALDGTLYVCCDDSKLYAFDTSGGVKWTFSTGDLMRTNPAVGADGTIYISSNDGKVYAVSPSGAEIWQYATGDAIESSPAIGQDGMLFIGSDDNKLYAFSPIIF